jgi:hypothetical protein
VSAESDNTIALSQINDLLEGCSKALGEAAKLISRAKFNSSENIKHIATALAEMLAIQQQIYAVRDDLTPEHLRPEWSRKDPMTQLHGELGVAVQCLAYARREIESSGLHPDETRRRVDEAAAIIQSILRDVHAARPDLARADDSP